MTTNYSVTTFAEHAAQVSRELGAKVNGTAWHCPVRCRDLIVVTAQHDMNKTAAFRRLKKQGKVASYARGR